MANLAPDPYVEERWSLVDVLEYWFWFAICMAFLFPLALVAFLDAIWTGLVWIAGHRWWRLLLGAAVAALGMALILLYAL